MGRSHGANLYLPQKENFAAVLWYVTGQRTCDKSDQAGNYSTLKCEFADVVKDTRSVASTRLLLRATRVKVLPEFKSRRLTGLHHYVAFL